MPRVSVIVPCYNSGATIESSLKAIRSSNFPVSELIVVDDHSGDDTARLAGFYADKVIHLDVNRGSGNARQIGVTQSTGEILCFVDSDIVIRPDTISQIVRFLSENPSVDAVTGRLAKHHPNDNFSSQYKNLYMHYIFGLLPERVSFIFGSLWGMRRSAVLRESCDMRYTPDTEYGQQLFQSGKTIAFSRDLDAVHLKKYTFWSLVVNDFRVPFSWAQLFMRFKGWKQLGKNKTGFAHSPKEQLFSVCLAPIIFLLTVTAFFAAAANLWLYPLLIIWLILNFQFLAFLHSEKGVLFSLKSAVMTLADQCIMALGIFCGIFTKDEFRAQG
jgi:glycosyltransferase involved in cell wall biosynthesis